MLGPRQPSRPLAGGWRAESGVANMGGILVDEVTAVYIVVAVAFAIFGGIFGYVWRLAASAGGAVRGVAAGFGLMAVIWLGFGAAGVMQVVKAVDAMLLLAAGGVLACWLIIFYFLWQIDRASGA
jgi:hypothetical protein